MDEMFKHFLIHRSHSLFFLFCIIQNEFMGFADFRAAFVAGTGAEWTIEPREGSLTAKSETVFLLRFKAQNPGLSEGILVIETEDFKKTYKLIGGTS